MRNGDVWFFDLIAPLYDWLMPTANRESLRAGLDSADRDIHRILDIGGGTGRAARALTIGERIVVDPSRGMLQQAPRELSRVQASGSVLPFQDTATDAILIVDALHHIPDTPLVVTEAFRVLRPGGVLVISDINRATISGRIIDVGESLIGLNSNFYTTTELVDTLTTANFDVTVLESGFTSVVVGRKPG